MRSITRRAALNAGSAALGSAAMAFGLHRYRHAPQAEHWLTSFVTPEPVSLLPGLDPSPGAALVQGKIYQGLLRFSDAMQPLPELAQSWTIDTGGRRCLFNIRPDVRFHDGRVLTAQDVVAAIRRQQGAAWSWIAAEAPNPSLVVVTGPGRLDRLLPLFDGLSCPVVPDGEAHAPIGTGPFQLERWDRGQAIRLQRNPHYWRGGQPMLGGIEYRVVPDAAVRLGLMQSGAAQLAQLHDLPLNALPAQGQGLTVSDAGWEYLRPTCRLDCGAALANPVLREAIGLAMDRDDLAQRVWAGRARVLGGPLPAAFSPGQPAPPKRDLRAAAALLHAAGLLPDEHGVRLHLRMLVPGWDPIWQRSAAAIANMLRQIGVAVEQSPAIGTDWQRRLAAQDYDLALRSVNSHGNAVLCLAESWMEQAGAAITAGRDANNDNAYREAIATAERGLVQSHAAIWLFEPRLPTVFAPKLHNPLAFATGPFAPFDYVYLDGN